MWHIANLELHCLIPHSTYLISIIVTSRMGLSFVEEHSYVPLHITVRTLEQKWCRQTRVKFLMWSALYYTVAAEEVWGKGRRNTDRTYFADKGLSAWKSENGVVRSLAFLPCFRKFRPILSLSLSEKYSSVAIFQVPAVFYGGIGKPKSRLKIFLRLQNFHMFAYVAKIFYVHVDVPPETCRAVCRYK